MTTNEPTFQITTSALDEFMRIAQVEALRSAEKALNRECLRFQSSWSSNEIDVAKLDVLGQALTWISDRAAKYDEVLPRTINLKDTYRSLSDGAVIEYRGVRYEHRLGHGDFVSDLGDRIVARLHDEDVTLLDNNLNLDLTN